MPETIETSRFDSDQFLRLLTDALRAGPGSPQWHEAVTQLRSSNPAQTDEYLLLIEAREHLESGREYRTVHAGPGFTRKVLDGIQQESAGKTALPSANIIAVIAVLGIIAAIIIVIVLLYRGAGPAGAISDLANTYFSRAVVASEFVQQIPPEWKKFGLEPAVSTTQRALRGNVFPQDKDYRGGGVFLSTPLRPEEPFAFEATVRMTKPTDQIALQLFISDDPAFGQNLRATNPQHEIVCYLSAGQWNVAKPDGSLEGPLKARELNHLVLKIDRQFIIVESDGQQLYAGLHELSTDKPRYVGIRFLTKAGAEDSLDDVVVPTTRLLTR